MNQALDTSKGSLVQRFLYWNKVASQQFDRLFGIPWVSIRNEERQVIESLLSPGAVVADVGGGKKPFFPSGDPRIHEYVGIDIDLDELQRAPTGSYDAISACDISCPDVDLTGKFDLIICNNTLEHVLDAEQGIAGLQSMLKPGGRCFLAVPCRLAPFALLNRWMPERLKQLVLFSLIPEKRGDGFVAHYDKATPSGFRSIIESLGAKLFYEKRFYWSSYFTIFLPAYIVWRALTGLARLVSPDYCERFHMTFERSSDI